MSESDTKKKISQFEKASKVKVLTDEEMRKKAKFNAKLGRFENACAVANGSAPAAPRPGVMERKDSTEVMNKAKFFVDAATTNAQKDDQDRQEKEMQARKDSFNKMKAGFEAEDASAAKAAFSSYDEMKEEEERKRREEEAERAEEDRRKKEEFKNKQSMFANS